MVSAYEILLSGGTMDKPIYQWQKDVPGLAVRINKSGRTCYVVKYSLNGRQVMDTIDSCDSMTKDQARSLVQQMRALARQGINPKFLLGSLVDSRGVHPGTVLFKTFAEEYISRHAKVHKSSWLKDQQRIDCYLQGWMELPLNSITPKHASILKERLKATPYAANRLFEQVSLMFKLAIKWGYLPPSYINPAFEIGYFEEISRDRFIRKQEMVQLAEVLRVYPHKMAVNCIKFDLYTGLRSGELTRLRWKNVDIFDGFLILDKKQVKTKRQHILPLSEPAMEILKELWKTRDPSNPFVFAGGRPGTHINRIDKHWRKIRKQAGLEDVWVHDLRRTVGSWTVQKTGNVAVVSEILNHTQEYTTETYGRFGREDVKLAINALGREMNHYLETLL